MSAATDSNPAAEHAAVAAVAEQVAAGNDTIAVPAELVHEPVTMRPTDRPPDQALWIRIKGMSMGERVKLAMRGNKEARMILIREVNPQIQRLVLLNPRITEEEILTICKDRNTDDDLLAVLADSRDWTKIYAVRSALVENAKTPVAKALRLLPTLDERDLSRLGKSKAVPNVIAVQARRIVFQMRDRR